MVTVKPITCVALRAGRAGAFAPAVAGHSPGGWRRHRPTCERPPRWAHPRRAALPWPRDPRLAAWCWRRAGPRGTPPPRINGCAAGGAFGARARPASNPGPRPTLEAFVGRVSLLRPLFFWDHMQRGGCRSPAGAGRALSAPPWGSGACMWCGAAPMQAGARAPAARARARRSVVSTHERARGPGGPRREEGRSGCSRRATRGRCEGGCGGGPPQGAAWVVVQGKARRAHAGWG